MPMLLQPSDDRVPVRAAAGQQDEDKGSIQRRRAPSGAQPRWMGVPEALRSEATASLSSTSYASREYPARTSGFPSDP